MNSPEIPDSCPFCGSVVSVLADGKPFRAADGAWVHFKCLTSMHMGQDPRMCQSRPCEEAERQRLTTEVDMLRTANAGLLEKVKRLEEAGDKLAGQHLLVVVTFDQATKHVAEWHAAKGQP